MDPILQTISVFERLRHAFPHRLQYCAHAGSALRGKPMRPALRRPPLSPPGKSERDLDNEKRNQEEELRLSFAKPGLTRVTLALLPITATICAGMPVALSDIARELGVSKMTVSRAINNNALISAETRQRVLEVARRMNYQPNQHARALATNRSYLIGIIVPDIMNLYFAEVIRAIETIARPAGFQLLICGTDEDTTRELEEVEALLQRTDGLIINSVFPPTETKAYRKMVKDGARIVFVDRTLDNLRCPSVATDNVKVGLLAT